MGVGAGAYVGGLRCRAFSLEDAFQLAIANPETDSIDIDLQPPQIPLICGQTGEVLTSATTATLGYWQQQGSAGRSARGMATLSQQGTAYFWN